MRRLMLSVLLTALLIPAVAARSQTAPDDRWYVVMIQGQRSGWMHEFTRTEGDTIETGSEMKLVFGRAGMTAEVGIETRFLETADGEPVTMSMTQRLGNVPSTTTFVFGADQIKITADNAGQTFTRTVPREEGDALTPAAAERDTARRLAAGETEFTTRTLTPLTGAAPITSTVRVLGEDTIDVLGRTVPALKMTVESSVSPGQSAVQFTDASGHVLRSEQSFGAMTMVVIAADKQLALSELDPAEMMAGTFVTPTGRRIEDPRRARTAVFRLRAPAGAVIPAFTGGAQTAERQPDGSVLVTVDLNSRSDTAPPTEADAASTSMLAADDPLVAQLAAQAGAEPEDLRSFVHSFITEKSLGVGFASASEVARARTGDCSEHGVLLAAMLRARGVPARVVSGLVYTQAFAGARDVFGFHVWTQAYIGGAWRDLDATLGTTPFDATHIALGASDMADGELVNSFVDIAPLIGTLEIEVVEIR